MAKILVADDNSNVQKTVTLALAGLGVEVISVSNGEAAVRKLSEFTPDLVLADIFMPVRNGYEVCEFVKKDSRFKQVPVVLLVGAFDPLDEREAQRVGADGILKKPFVPPDPLIAMIKTLLDRALGERLVAVGVSKPEAAVASKNGGAAVVDAPAPAPQPAEDFPELEPVRPVSRSAFEDVGETSAFDQLLGSPERDSTTAAIEPVDDEQILTSQRDATLGDPIFWRNDAPEPEPEAVKDDATAGVDLHEWSPGTEALSPREDSSLLQPIEPLELVRDGEDEPSSSVVESGSILLDAASQAALTVQPGKAEELAANPIEWMATAPVVLHEALADPAPERDEEIPAAHHPIDLDEVAPPEPARPSATVPEAVSAKAVIPDLETVVVPVRAFEIIPDKTGDPDKTQDSLTPSAQDESPTVTPQTAAPQNVKLENVPSQKVDDTAHSIPKHDWADLADMLRTAPAESEPEKAAPESAALPASLSTLNTPTPASVTKPVTPSSALQRIPFASVGTPVTSKSAPEQAAQAAPPEAPAESAAPKFSPPVFTPPVKPSSPDPALVEAVVQKVLDKMRPQVVEIITKEFLRPIVEALVHREIKKQ